MKCHPCCKPCLERLLSTAAEAAAGGDACLRERALDAARAALADDFCPGQSVPTRLATECLRRIHAVTGNHDPFAVIKYEELAAARRTLPLLAHRFGSNLHDRLRLSALGNRLDFFRAVEDVEREWQQHRVHLAVDDTPAFAAHLTATKRLLFLTDNVGETLFDLPLLDFLRYRGIEITVAVKGQASQNDLTRADADRWQLPLPNLVDTGTDAVGCDLDAVGATLHRAWDRADLVLAKGMANFETLSEHPHQLSGKTVYFLLCAKCPPVAQFWRVDVGDSVFAAARDRAGVEAR